MNEQTICVICNCQHLGAILDHVHQGADGVGYVRLLVIGKVIEFCWRCSCRKSGWTDMPNIITSHCSNTDCLCHTTDRAL